MSKESCNCSVAETIRMLLLSRARTVPRIRITVSRTQKAILEQIHEEPSISNERRGILIGHVSSYEIKTVHTYYV